MNGVGIIMREIKEGNGVIIESYYMRFIFNAQTVCVYSFSQNQRQIKFNPAARRVLR